MKCLEFDKSLVLKRKYLSTFFFYLIFVVVVVVSILKKIK